MEGSLLRAMNKYGRKKDMRVGVVFGIIFIIVSLFWGGVGYRYYTDKNREPSNAKFMGRLFFLMSAVMLIVSVHLVVMSIQ